jgi:ATP-binding protein involved in chromosome partitioning
MSYFSPKELPENKYYIFGRKGAEHLAAEKKIPFLGGLPLVQSVREAADVGRPASLKQDSTWSENFKTIAKNMVSQVVKRNKNLPPTKAVAITNMVGCEAIKT